MVEAFGAGWGGSAGDATGPMCPPVDGVGQLPECGVHEQFAERLSSSLSATCQWDMACFAIAAVGRNDLTVKCCS